MEKNETGCQAPPDAPVLCVNNCGFFGTAATMNMCSKCHKDTIFKQEHAKLAASSIETFVNGGGGGGGSLNTTTADNQSAAAAAAPSCSVSEPAEGGENPKAGPTRCTACRKRVGLTGFHCRCGDLFCSVHRYSDKHECPFDYRATGQDAIAKANPMVKAQKLDKI